MNISPPLRLIFMGTPNFSVPALEALIHSHHSVVAVYSQPPRPSGRGQKVTKSPIHAVADHHNIPVFTPTSLRPSTAQEDFAALKADLAIVAAYGLILPKDILEAPAYGCLNIHASLLPKWRGAAPIQRAILAGDTVSGITLMQMDIGLDTGDMLTKESVVITPHTTGQTLHDDLSHLGAKMLLPLLDRLKTTLPEKQNEALATYATKLSKTEASLDFRKPARELERQIRAFTPWPGSFFKWQNKAIKILKATVIDCPASYAPGTFITTKTTCALTCGDNALSLETIQLQGKKPMDIKAFLNGYAPKEGDRVTLESPPTAALETSHASV